MPESVTGIDDVEEAKDWLVGEETGCWFTSPLSGQSVWPVLGLSGRVNGSRLTGTTGTTSSPYSNRGEKLTGNRKRNTDDREPEVEPTAVLLIASGVEGVSADHSVAIALVQ